MRLVLNESLGRLDNGTSECLKTTEKITVLPANLFIVIGGMFLVGVIVMAVLAGILTSRVFGLDFGWKVILFQIFLIVLSLMLSVWIDYSLRLHLGQLLPLSVPIAVVMCERLLSASVKRLNR